MTAFLYWAVSTLLLSGALLLLFVWRTPFFITKAVIRGFSRKMEGEPWNRFRLSGLATSGSDSIVMTSPDMIYMFGVYEVSEQPVVIHCVVPENDTYWCVSLYALNTDNFYFRNDRASKDREFDLVIAGPQSQHRKSGNEDLVVAPTRRGVILIRAVVKDPEDSTEVTRLQAMLKRTTIMPYDEWRSGKSAVASTSGTAQVTTDQTSH